MMGSAAQVNRPDPSAPGRAIHTLDEATPGPTPKREPPEPYRPRLQNFAIFENYS